MHSVQKNSNSGSIVISVFIAAAISIAAVDEILKFFALKNLPFAETLDTNQIIALAVHKNYGIAFNIPIPQSIIIALTLAIIGILIKIAYTTRKSNTAFCCASILVIVGALANLFDRVFYQYTVDYIILFNRSAINMVDILIICGIVWMLTENRRKIA